jgi:hypothetical protein
MRLLDRNAIERLLFRVAHRNVGQAVLDQGTVAPAKAHAGDAVHEVHTCLTGRAEAFRATNACPVSG